MEVKDLNIIPSGDMPVIHVSQFDINRTFKFNLKEDGEDYTLTSGITITCAIKKVDGNLVTFEVTNTADKYIELTLPEQATACAGINIGEVIFTYEDNYEIGSINFILDVERSPKLGGIESESSIHDLTEQIEEITLNVILTDPEFIEKLKSGLDIPTKTSDLENDSGFITENDVPNKLSDLSDIKFENLTNGQIIKYNASTEKFENANESGGGGSYHSYSTTEHQIGTWVDNSPIYEQSISISNLSMPIGWKVIGTIQGIKDFIDCEQCLKSNDNIYSYSNLPADYNYNNGSISVYNGLGGNMGYMTGYATVRYTKVSSQ